jgi:NAD(P)-dependent dehydrogenase (short-subunit alcohol dehydrogenase family)
MQGKVAIVFGSGGSIGKAIVAYLHSKEVKVIGIGRSNRGSNTDAFYVCDLGSEKQIAATHETIKKEHGDYHYLILAHGTQLRKPFIEFTLDEWNEIISINLTSNFLICKYFIDVLIRNKFGRIMGISSLTSQIGLRRIAPYAASKGGFEQMLKTLAVEVAEYGITVNTLNPGRIETKMTNDLKDKQNSKESIISRIPMNRFGNPDDLLSAVQFILDDKSGYFTGQSIVVDGGWLASGGNPKS